jgi:heme A synthase
MTGAVTALGDTVYPVRGNSTLERLQNDQAVDAHFLGKVRVVHPLIALLGVAALWIAGSRARDAGKAALIQRLGVGLYAGGALALAIGLLNIMLAAPGYLQVIHLAMACLLWLGTVVLASALWDAQRREPSSQ